MLIESRETPAETARRLAPTSWQEAADRRQEELERPFKAILRFNREHAEWDREVLTPWSLTDKKYQQAENEAEGSYNVAYGFVKAKLEECLRLNYDAARCEYEERLRAFEANDEPDLTPADRKREIAAEKFAKEIPALLKQRAEAHADWRAAEQSRDQWLASNPRPTPPYTQARPTLLTRE